MNEQLYFFPGPTPPVRDWYRRVRVDRGGPDPEAAANYSPSHPWYYLRGGRKLDLSEILPGNWFDGDKPPKDIVSAMAAERCGLARDEERYEQLCTFGYAVMSRYDLEIAYQDDWDLAEAAALGFSISHISNGRGRVAWLEKLLMNPQTKPKKTKKGKAV